MNNIIDITGRLRAREIVGPLLGPGSSTAILNREDLAIIAILEEGLGAEALDLALSLLHYR